MAQEKVETVSKRGHRSTFSWSKIELLLGFLALVAVLSLYLSFDGAAHFFLHVLIGWDVGLLFLLTMTYLGRHWSYWDGFFLFGTSMYALTPDFIYRFSFFHRDWMDVFLFHVALDEILPFALPVLAVLCVALLGAYIWLRVKEVYPEDTDTSRGNEWDISLEQKRWLRSSPDHRLGLFLMLSLIILIVVNTGGVIRERTTHTPFIQVGQPAPQFALPSMNGTTETLQTAPKHVVLLMFLPSVLCDFCQRQLQTLEEMLPQLETHGVVAYVISTDTPLVERTIAQHLGLACLLLSEAPTLDQHPAGSAYGVYHASLQNAGPVDANAIVVIDEENTVRAIRMLPDQALSSQEIGLLVNEAFGLYGAR